MPQRERSRQWNPDIPAIQKGANAANGKPETARGSFRSPTRHATG
jgi:hypothetical protein